MALSALNLWMMEYFFVLELLRPLVIFRAAQVAQPGAAVRSLFGRVMWNWLPYLIAFAVNILWRLFVFNNQIYEPTLAGTLRSNPLQAAAGMAMTSGQQLYRTFLVAWAGILAVPSATRDGPRTVAYYCIITVLVAAITGIMILRARSNAESNARGDWAPIVFGLAAVVLAGGPFLLTGLEVTTAYPANRFTLPFMLGVSLMLAGLLMFVPARARIWAFVILMGLAAGRQALWAEAYRRDWATQKSLFWQLYWRAPGIEPNTAVLLNEGALPYYADNSLIGPLNWIYDPDNRSVAMEYALFYPTSRSGGTLPRLVPGQPIEYDFISEAFSGSTSQTLAVYFKPPGCLRVLDPEIDSANRLIPDDSMMREAALLSSDRWIHPDDGAKMPAIYGPEPPHGWCYHFERAALAAQQRNGNSSSS